MSTRGFYHDPGQDINQLKVILTDQYKLDQKWKGFSILKELVQNADDASATELHIGWSRGIPEADHPLLTEPALFVINNGEFKKQDTKSIRTMSLGHKVGQEESIGKFGLGLKSLFHLGEMFFYLASDGPTAEPKEEFARNNLLNPWSGIYDDLNWDEFSPKSQVAIKRQVASILDKMPQWFCLWVPFRHKNHMSDPLIGSFYPDNWKYIFFPDVDRHLANLFPMLKNLTRIKGWFPDENNQSLREIFTIELDNFGYRLNHDKITRGQEAPLAGQVNIERSSNATNPSVHIFGGKHKLLDDKTLWQLKEEENWPKSSGFDSISDKTLHNLQDKAKPHCAVCFAQFPASSPGNGNLDISWSVFLPLSKMQETQSCRGDTDYLLILHGYFFVDAGRALFEGDGSIGIDKSSDESSVRLKWNGRLRAIGTLPLVLPALEQFVESANLSTQKVYALTEALMKSDLFKDHWEICSQHQWIYRIHETGVGWELVGAENEVYTVPLLASKAATDFPGQVFPSFANLSAQYCITINSYPFLGRKSPSNHWPTELLSQLLSDINIVEIFENRDRLEYFVRFLEQSRQVILLTPQLQQILRYLARQVFTQIELKQLRGFRELVQRFLNLILPEQRFVFTQATASVWDTALLELLRLDLEVLIVPAGLDSKEGNRLTNPEDVSKILCRLADLLVDQSNKHFIDVCADIARLVLEATDEAERLPILQQCSDLKLFKAQDYQAKGENTLLCWRNFEELKNSRTVFSGAAGKPETLQKALKNEHVVLIDYKLAEVLFGKLQIPQYNPGSCLQTLLRRPLLAEPEARLELLSFIDNQISTPGYADAVRYLLHAQAEDNFASLLVNGSARRPVWTKIIEQIVPKWRVIPEQMANKLARDPHWRILNISEIDVTNVIRHIQEVGPRQIDCSTFNDDDRDTLLREIQDSNDILKGLHIHRSIDDNFVAVVDGKTFLDSDVRSCLDNSLLTQLVLIQPIRQDPQTLLATKQRQLIPPLDAKSIIELVFKQSRPENHWRVIMAVLLSDVRKDQTLDKDLRNKLRKAKWLPTDNHFVAPEDVLYIPGLEDEITRLVSALPGVFVEIQMLHKDISENKDAKKLLARSYFPSQSEALAMLGQMMANDPKYHVGILETSDLTGEKLQNFVEVFDPTVMPACQVLKTILDKVPLDDCLGLFRELIREISVDRIIAVLNYLAEQHQNTPQHKNKFMAIHTWYLASVSQSSDLHNSVLPKIKLLNQRAEWKSTEQLCFEKYGQGIDAGDILDKKQEKIIRKAYPNKLDEEVEVIEVQGSLPPQISGGNLDKHLNASVDLLKEYFKGWGGLVADQLIGSFLCLLGEHQSLHQLAETYLYPRTVAGTREILDWEPNTGAVLAGQSQNIREVMEQTRYIVTVEDAGLTLKVQSITGSYFEARRKPESEFQHLFAGAIVSFSEKSLAGLSLACKVRQLRLIRIHSDARRSELLQNSAREIFKICLRDALPDQSRIVDQSPERVLRALILQRLRKFDQCWEELAHKEQLDILIAQDLLLEAAFFYLKQLGIPSESKIGRILKRLDDVRFRQTEEKQASNLSARARGQKEILSSDLQKEMQETRTELQNLLEEDQDTHLLLLKSVRDKVEANRYRTQSIPFELFQNADDAVVELHEMTEVLDSLSTNVVLKWDGQKICFIHWGRPINKFRDVGFDDGRRRGYHRDLEKMLVMSYSDKILEADGVPVTGKFGLGFKSVFLISDSPTVISGQLGFKVIGGMYPKRLLTDEMEQLQGYLEDKLQRHKATIIELPVVKDINVNPDVVQDFSDLVHIMLVFAHRIKRCFLNSSNLVSWHEEKLLDLEKVFIGELRPVNNSEPSNALIFRTGKIVIDQKPQTGAILLELGSRGFRSLPKNIPTIWATAPTQEKLETGFVVNGSFDLDVGRARLDTANIKGNFNLARIMGDEFGKSLRQLFDISSRDWSKLREALLLAKDVREYDFWYSLWRLLADDFSSKLDSRDILHLLHNMLWGDSTQPRAMTQLIMECCALPTGLWGDFQVLTQLNNVKYITEGVLDSREVFNTVSSWILDKDQKVLGTLISERTAKVIIKLLQSESSEDEKKTKSVREQLTQITKALYRDEADHLSIQSLRLHQVIDGRIARLKGDIDRGSAEQFGTLITPPFMKQHDLEAGEIRVHLKGTRFLNQEGNYYPVTELLIAVDSFESSNEQEDEQAVHELKEEQSIASFAPNGRILANEYKGDALAFFKICRQKRSTSSKELVNWAFNTKEDSKQVNLLRYLLGKRDLAEEIRTDLRFKESWLAQLNENSSILVRNFDEGEISELLVLLRLRLINRDTNQELRPSPPQRVNVNPKELLAKIYHWWVDKGNKQKLISWYEKKIYHDLPPKLHFADENVLKNNLEARRHWLVLFLLGSSHTMGWFDPMSPDRNFLALCRDKGWLDTFANPGSTAKDWIGVLDKYLDEKIESDISYQHWMRQFVGIYQLARELPEYVGAFSRIGEVRDSFSLDAFTRLKQSPLFSRGGYSASRIDRTLGAGACFVVRELVRKELITSPHAYEHCYTPVNAVRDRFFELGCDDLEDDTKVNNSKIMFRFLREHMDQKKVTFDHSFDLPFLFITKGWGSIDEFARNF